MIVLAKDFLDHQHHGPGRAKPQLLGELYPQPQMLYHPIRAEDAWVELPVEVKAKEPLRLLINATRAPDSGIYQAYLDDVPVGKPIDLYNDKVDNFEFHLLDFWPEPGKYTFTLECVGQERQVARASTSAWKAFASASAAPASRNTATTRTRTGGRTRRCLKTTSA